MTGPVSEVQATVRTWGPDGGALVRDDGVVLTAPEAARDPAALRLHPGQRVRVRLDDDGQVAAVTLVGLPFT